MLEILFLTPVCTSHHINRGKSANRPSVVQIYFILFPPPLLHHPSASPELLFYLKVFVCFRVRSTQSLHEKLAEDLESISASATWSLRFLLLRHLKVQTETRFLFEDWHALLKLLQNWKKKKEENCWSFNAWPELLERENSSQKTGFSHLGGEY